MNSLIYVCMCIGIGASLVSIVKGFTKRDPVYRLFDYKPLELILAALVMVPYVWFCVCVLAPAPVGWLVKLSLWFLADVVRTAWMVTVHFWFRPIGWSWSRSLLRALGVVRDAPWEGFKVTI